jgi:peptidoglycan/LPS O-acetylase OafA/YrhL
MPPVAIRTTNNWRKDIDGLRAVAICSVVYFHAIPLWGRGGFTGVDVFFVISGYLISKIIFQGLAYQTFSFKEFYWRRIKRIFPALLLVLIASVSFGWISLFPYEYKQLGKHVASGSAFVSNLVLWDESGYFDTASRQKPLLHLWSLGIEEQFYIFWPILLWLIHKLKLPMIPIISGLIIFSFCLGLTQIDGLDYFYSPLTRAWELMCGGLLAHLEIHKQNSLQKLSTLRLNTFSVLGVTLIGLGFWFINKTNSFPNWTGLLPVAGAMFVILGGDKAYFNRFILSHPIAIWLGLISYPLYLWHWPILSFLDIIFGQTPSLTVRLGGMAAAVVLAWMTHVYIERPLRNNISLGIAAPALTVIAGFTFCLGLGIYQTNGLPERLGEKIVKSQSGLQDVVNIEKIHDAKSSKAIVVLGDSHATLLSYAIAEINSFNVHNLSRGTCPPFLGVEVFLKDGNSVKCQPHVNEALKTAMDSNANIIVLTAFFNQYNRDVFLYFQDQPISVAAALAQTVNLLATSGKKIVIALDVPEIAIDCGKARPIPVWTLEKERNNNPCLINKEKIVEQQNQILGNIRYRGNFDIIDLSIPFCDIQCGEIDNSHYLYMPDGNHLNTEGIKRLGEYLRLRLTE